MGVVTQYRIMLDGDRFHRASSKIVLDGRSSQHKLRTYFDPVLTFQNIFIATQVIGLFLLVLLWNDMDNFSRLGYSLAISIGQVAGVCWATRSLFEIENGMVNLGRIYRRLFAFAIFYALCVDVAVIMWIRSAPDNVLLIHFASWAIAIIALHGAHYFNTTIAITILTLNLVLFLAAAAFVATKNPHFREILELPNMMLPFSVTLIAALLTRRIVTSHYCLGLENQTNLSKEQVRTRQSLDEVTRLNMQMSSIANSSEHGIALINHKGIIELMNSRFSEIFGLAEGQTKLFARDVLPRQIVEPPATQFEYHHTDNCVFLVSNMAVMATDEACTQLLFVTDITQKTHDDQARTRLEKLGVIGTLSSGIAHDFNNLLAIIQNQIELLLIEEPRLDDAEPITDMRYAISSASALARQLLAYTHEIPLDDKAVRLSALVHETTAMAETSIGAEITLAVDCQSEAPVILDPHIFKVNLLNIILNARDAINASEKSEMGRIDIEVKAIADQVIVEVRDNGAGISDETLRQVTEPFFSTKDRETNTGLGLALAKSFIKKSGGDLTIASQLGLGTKVVIALPIATRRAGDGAQRPADESYAIGAIGGAMHIAVIDDNLALLRSQTLLLENYFTDVEGFQSIDELKSADRLGHYDVVLCDLFLHEETGVDVLRLFRAEGLSTPVVFFSGNVPPDLRAEITSIEDAIILEKPVPIHRLISALNAAAKKDAVVA